MNVIKLQGVKPEQTPTVPAFMGNPKNIAAQKVMSSLSDKMIESALSVGDTVDLKNIINDPNKKNVFFSIIGSLVTATAIKITELLTNDSNASTERITNKDGDVLEVTTVVEKKEPKPRKKETLSKKSKVLTEKPIKFVKHFGIPFKPEKSLEMAVKNKIAALDLDIEYQNKLITLYNNFCGPNYKSNSYNENNEEFPNSVISSELSAKIDESTVVKDLDAIIDEYSKFSSTKREISSIPGIEQVPLKNTEVETKEAVVEPQKVQEVTKIKPLIHIPSNIKTRENIKSVYEGLDSDSRVLVNKFLSSEFFSKNPVLQKKVLQNINNKQSALLLNIAKIYNYYEEVDSDCREEFLTILANNQISPEAVETWDSQNASDSFDFLEYNSMLFNNVPTNSIESLKSMRKKGFLGALRIKSDKNFEVLLPNRRIIDRFRTIHDVFSLLRDDFQMLNSTNKDYVISDISIEVNKNKNTYKRLHKYLDEGSKKGLNAGKMAALLDIYNSDNINKDLLTLHSYLRFLERYVMPQFDSNDADKHISTGAIKKVYIKTYKKFRDALNSNLNKMIEVKEYSITDDVKDVTIKAPKLIVPMDDNSDKFYELTIDSLGKIHTIF